MTEPGGISITSAYASRYLEERLERLETTPSIETVELKEARRKIRALQRELKQVKDDLQKLRDELSAAQSAVADARVGEQKARTEAEATIGDSKATISRLEAMTESLGERVSDLQRLSLRAIVTAWVGTVLVAFGVNILTDGSRSGLGIALILVGAALEALAYYIGTASRSRRSQG